jgi:hypothetical protein
MLRHTIAIVSQVYLRSNEIIINLSFCDSIQFLRGRLCHLIQIDIIPAFLWDNIEFESRFRINKIRRCLHVMRVDLKEIPALKLLPLEARLQVRWQFEFDCFTCNLIELASLELYIRLENHVFDNVRGEFPADCLDIRVRGLPKELYFPNDIETQYF